MLRSGYPRALLLLLLAIAVAPGLTTLASGQTPRHAPVQEYRVGAKDVLKITVWGHEDLSRPVVVSADGTFQFPLIGDVRVAGLTPGAIEALLRDLLGKDYLVNPQVSVSVQEYRSQRVFVLGEVEKPGTYAMTGQTTLLDVLSQAGGPGKNAGRQVVVVRFPRSEGPVTPGAAGQRDAARQPQAPSGRERGENIVLQNGDTVFVPKLTSFFVLGEVLRQGAYAMDKETTALEAVTLAGGFTDRAAPSGAKILRDEPGRRPGDDRDRSDRSEGARGPSRRGRHAAGSPRATPSSSRERCGSRGRTSSRNRRRPSAP